MTGVDWIGVGVMLAEVLGIFLVFSIAARYVESKGTQANG